MESYFIEASALKTPSRKPSHLQKRFRSESASKCEQAIEKKNKIMSNIQERLFERHSHVQKAVQKVKNKRRVDSQAKISQIQQSMELVEQNRMKIINQRMIENSNKVKAAKLKARLQEQKLRNQVAELQKNLNQKVRISTTRRSRLLSVPRSQIMRESSISDVVERDEAALTIQNWFRKLKFNAIARIYRKVGVTQLQAMKLGYDQLMNKVQNETTIKAAKFLLMRARRTCGDKTKYSNPARILLLAYVIATHPLDILPDGGEDELIALASATVKKFEHYLTANKNHLKLANDFIKQFNQFAKIFLTWKKGDQTKVVENLVGYFIELDQLWIKVRDRSDAHLEWAEHVSRHQKLHSTRIKRYGAEAVEKLEKARNESIISMKNLGINLEIVQGCDSLAPATEYFVAVVVDSLTPAPEDANTAELTNNDQQRFGSVLSNQQLAHELVMNPNFKLEAPARSEMEERIHLIARKAFIDNLDQKIKNSEYEQVLPLLMEIKQGLLSMVKENGHKANEIEEAYDEDFIKSQMKNNVFDLQKLLRHTAKLMLSLCAPARDEEIKNVENVQSFAEALLVLVDIVEKMKLDLSNFRLQSIRPTLIKEAAVYEAEKFEESLKNKSKSLERTMAWLKQAMFECKSKLSEVSTSQETPSFQEIFSQAFLDLLFTSTSKNANELPETFELDTFRIFEFQNNLQAVTIVSALVTISKNIVPELRNEDQTLNKLANELMQLMEKVDTNINTLADAIIESANMLLHRNAKLKSMLSEQTSMPEQTRLRALGEEQESMIRTMVDKTMSFTDPLFNVLLRRVEKVTRQAVMGTMPSGDSLKKMGLNYVETELVETLSKIQSLAVYNKKVYGKHYNDILSSIVQ